MQITDKTILWTSSGWAAIIVFLIAAVAWLWQLPPEVIRFILGLALLPVILMVSVLFIEFCEWIEVKRLGQGWESIPPEPSLPPIRRTKKLKLKRKNEEIKTPRELAAEKVLKAPIADYTENFNRWKKQQRGGKDIADLIDEVRTHEPQIRPAKTENKAENKAGTCKPPRSSRFPYLPRPDSEGLR